MGKLLLKLIFSLFFWITGIISAILFAPIQAILVVLFPDFSAYAAEVINYIILHIFPLVTWIKHCLINITGLPEGLWLLIVAQVVALNAAAKSVGIYYLFMRVYSYLKGQFNSFRS